MIFEYKKYTMPQIYDYMYAWGEDDEGLLSYSSIFWSMFEHLVYRENRILLVNWIGGSTSELYLFAAFFRRS